VSAGGGARAARFASSSRLGSGENGPSLPRAAGVARGSGIMLMRLRIRNGEVTGLRLHVSPFGALPSWGRFSSGSVLRSDSLDEDLWPSGQGLRRRGPGASDRLRALIL
jgi:hypothetical protein